MPIAKINDLLLRRLTFTCAMLSAALLALTVTGCGGDGSGSDGGGVTGAPAPLADGSALGARGPIVGATVAAYKAGTTGYGLGATALATAITNSSGKFTFTSGSCNTGDLIYYVSRGGNAGAGVNPAIVLMSAVGVCGSLPTSVLINEVTTVATVYALAQFIGRSSPYAVGASSSNINGIRNAFAAVGNLANVTTGAARAVTPTDGTAPQRNVNTLANALVSCVNSGPGSATCAELFACAKPRATFGTACSGGIGATPADTLGAALNVALNPFRVSVAGVYHAATIQPVFTPALASAPHDWTLALTFGIPFVTGSGYDALVQLAIDAAGDVWVTNEGGDSVTKLTSTGGLAGIFNNTNTPGANFYSPFGLAFDPTGNVWVVNCHGSSVTELDSNGALVGNFVLVGRSAEPFDIAIDPAGNVWVTNSSNSVFKLNSKGALIGNFDNLNTPGANSTFPENPAVDGLGNVWVTNALDGSSVTELTSTGVLVGNFNNSNTVGAPFNITADLTLDSSGNVWVANNNAHNVVELNSKGAFVGKFAPAGSNFDYPYEIATDAASNVWVINVDATTVTELNSKGLLVGNFAITSVVNPNMAIDPAGNVWITKEYSDAVIELIGVAVPVLTPLVACLKQSPPHAVCLP